MLRFFSLILFLLISLYPFSAFTEEVTYSQRQMINDLNFIANVFKINYAPFNWKKENFGWDLDLEKEKAHQTILNNPGLTTKEFQRLLKRFCVATKDYHVSPHFYSTEYASLPFHIQSAGNRYFISYVETAALSVGDEIISFNGTPISEFIEEFRKKEVGSNNLETDKALAEFYLTNRFGAIGHEVPEGNVEITYLSTDSNEIQMFEGEWDYRTEKIAAPLSIQKSLNPKGKSLQKDPFHKKFMTPLCNLKISKKLSQDASDLFGDRISPIPPLGTIVWESEYSSEFHAYLFLMDDLSVGAYVRIPSFYVDGDSAAAEFAELIEIFDEISDILVIDQLNNGGGMVLYMYAIAALLTDYELEVPMHRVRLTQEDVYYSLKRNQQMESIKNDRAARKKLGETAEGVVVNFKLVNCFINFHNFIIDQWTQGNLFTEYCYLYGIEKISPHPEVNYKKPILILTNSLDFSAADFFPAIMQDNNRAKIMGTRTAGAGGYLEKLSFPNLNGIEAIEFTASFSRRSNGMPIENTGVTPDVIYEVSEVDLKNNYSDYKQNILQELRTMLSKE